MFLRENNYTFTANWKELADYILKIAQVDDNQLDYESVYSWIQKRIEYKKV